MTTASLLQHTLSGPAVCAGVGVHSGQRVRLAVRPAAANAGVVFVRTDVSDRDNRIPVSAQAVTCTQLNTKISNTSGVSVSTIEHLMAALSALDVDNVIVEVDGPEVPIMDGSALPFVQLLDRAGRRTQASPRRYIEVLGAVEVADGAKRAALLPCNRFEVAFKIAFPSAVIGRQAVDLPVTERSFRDQLAGARTFGFVNEVEALRRLGLARGASLHNAIALDGDVMLNAEPLRFRDEFARHKALDAIGDLYVMGAPVIGRFETRYGGHALNNVLVRALMADPAAWRVRTLAPELAEAV
ncbi:UDP-3-O-acyl-N-acetylglucosamine deacetylase [Caulobacter sp. S45]|uniref:UDP-3-O-acyl-N-acetylglucosamine deacetylase n=1 Tax=Caulobacter sp. S45 TaxID=1641861 RepID=UPI0020C6D265|nr:UDP-3-O-acyl-N-acetylglucosamine deacetylase [Caulobacter sp. S45]